MRSQASCHGRVYISVQGSPNPFVIPAFIVIGLHLDLDS